MRKPFVEQDCTFISNGHSFTAGGAVLTEDHAIGYPNGAGYLKTWHGQIMGTYTILRVVPGFHGSRLFCFRVTMNDGSLYYGRGLGPAMILRLRRRKGDHRR